MAFDGTVVSALTHELNTKLIHGHIRKIAQPEPDELLISIQTPADKDDMGNLIRERANYKLKLSANASLPLVYLTSESKTSPLTAPNFCMLLRKHLTGARIDNIEQIGLERVISIHLYNHNELGDEVHPRLNIEIMGKHSNIIFIDENDHIIDSIKHVNGLTSSVREVLPGRDYFIPNTLDKIDPFEVTTEVWNDLVFHKPTTVAKAMSTSFIGFSQSLSHELAYRASLDGDASFASLNGNERSALMDEFRTLMDDIKFHNFSPAIYFDGEMPKDFSAVKMTMYEACKSQNFNSISEAVETYYIEKDRLTRIHAKSADLLTSIKTHRDRCAKKLDLLTKQLRDTEKKDKYKIYGELITTYGYSLTLPAPESDPNPPVKLRCTNHYDGKEVEIPIDPTLSVADNANRYFEKYNKQKRTYAAVTEQIEDAENELEHLESILTELDIARTEEDLVAIRAELADSGYIKNTSSKKNKKLPKSSPLHFISSDGYDIYVGKNNYQNEDITFHLATGNDWWFHAKQMPGSHVILKSGDAEPSDSAFEEAAALAAYFSKGRSAEKVEIDYIQKKHVKKPAGGKPGFVVYYTNFSMMANTNDISKVTPAGEEEKLFL